MLTSADLSADFRRLGLSPGDDVLVHSSFKSLGPVEGGPSTVIQAVLDSIQPEGTALFPTHTWALVKDEPDWAFDVRSTPSAAIGIIPETARQWPAGRRSVHPTHSVVAIGPRAEWFTERHFDAGMCGLGSPYDLLCEAGGWILLLGVDQERNTSLHMPEELLRIPGTLDVARVCRVTGYDGVERARPSHTHTWRERRFMVLDEAIETLGIQRRGPVGAADSRLIRAADLRAFAIEQLTANPGYFWR